MLFYFDHFIEIFLLPPGNILLLALIGFIISRFWPIFGKSLIIISFISLWLLSTPLIAQRLIDSLQNQYPSLSPDQLHENKQAAIVVLESDLNLKTPEYNYVPAPSEATLARLRYAAFLYQKTGAPILVSGNDPSAPSVNQAEYMARALKDYFNVPTQWQEDRGYNTAEEGILSSALLKKAGIKKIYLVTSAFHMPRAMSAFQNRGIEIIPAPTAYKATDSTVKKISSFLPTIAMLVVSTSALYEYIGFYWYRIHYHF